MKRTIIIFMALLLITLVGCNSNELGGFVETFNKRAESENVAELMPDEFGEIEKDDGDMWQEIYESEKYQIEVNYKNKSTISGYSVSIESKELLKGQKSEGYRASALTARALGLDVSGYANNFTKALNTDIHSYTDNGYEVRFINTGYGSSLSLPMYISFNKE